MLRDTSGAGEKKETREGRQLIKCALSDQLPQWGLELNPRRNTWPQNFQSRREWAGTLYSNTQESGVERVFWGCNSLALLECSAGTAAVLGIWMDPEAILLSEIFQTRKTNTV